MLDIGVNLTSSQFAQDVPQVVARARQVGLNGMIITGTDLAGSVQARSLAQRYPGFCWSTAGVHPHEAHRWGKHSAAALARLLCDPKVVAVGECGLDFARNFSSPAQQEAAFDAQLSLAARLAKPLFLHCREAHPRFIALLRPWVTQIPGAVVHCFIGTREELEACLALGLSIGITGWICDERRGVALRALLPHIPAERLLLETDAPYLLPRDLEPKPKSRRNEPCFLPHIVEQAARWRQEDAGWLRQVTEDNARRLFRLA